jgi:hypothetical protein
MMKYIPSPCSGTEPRRFRVQFLCSGNEIILHPFCTGIYEDITVEQVISRVAVRVFWPQHYVQLIVGDPSAEPEAIFKLDPDTAAASETPLSSLEPTKGWVTLYAVKVKPRPNAELFCHICGMMLNGQVAWKIHCHHRLHGRKHHANVRSLEYHERRANKKRHPWY